MRYAIKLGNQFYNDGFLSPEIEGFGPKEHATSWASKEIPERIVRYWFNNNDNPKDVNSWYCMRQGANLGAFVYNAETKTRHPNTGPFPEIVEVDFGKPPWNEIF